MVDKIRANHNRESPDVPVDDEAGAVLVIAYVWDANTQQYVVQTKGDGGGGGTSTYIKRDSDGALINPARSEDITALQTAVAKETTLEALRADFNGEDFATEFTLAQLLTAFNAEDFSTETTLSALRTDFNGEDFATEFTLELIRQAVANLPNVRIREENTAYLKYSAPGPVTVAAASWVTLASIVVPTGKTYKLKMAEGDFTDLVSLDTARGIRIQQAGTVRASVFTGAQQPNPDIEGLILSNTSGADETWALQGRHGGAVASRDMVGWFSWVDVT